MMSVDAFTRLCFAQCLFNYLIVSNIGRLKSKKRKRELESRGIFFLWNFPTNSSNLWKFINKKFLTLKADRRSGAISEEQCPSNELVNVITAFFFGCCQRLHRFTILCVVDCAFWRLVNWPSPSVINLSRLKNRTVDIYSHLLQNKLLN